MTYRFDSTILEKSLAFSAAPPIRPPSTSFLLNISEALFGFTLPPYSIETLLEISLPKLSEIHFLTY